MESNSHLLKFEGFEIQKLLGSGATSDVYLVTRNGKNYAIKSFKNRDRTKIQQELLSFRKEAAVMARVNHPNIIGVHEVHENANNAYLVMEFVDGEGLERALQNGAMKENEWSSIIIQLAKALDALHLRGIVHQDIKPQNILLTSGYKPKIIDFGFAKEVNEKNISETAVGTLLYSSPEQMGVLRRPISARSDLYSLGVVMFQCVTGQLPYFSNDPLELIQLHFTGKIPNACEINPQVRPIVARIISKLLAKEPDDRYQSGGGLAWDLEHLDECDTVCNLGTHDVRVQVIDIPLIGRDGELAVLKQAWEKVKKGHGQVVQVEGESGGGKTRLVRELIQFAQTEKALVFSGKAQQTEKTPYGTLKEGLDRYCSSILWADENIRKQEIENIKSIVADLKDNIYPFSQLLNKVISNSEETIPSESHSVASGEQEIFYKAVAQFFVRIAKKKGPLILLLDDIQWLDHGSLEILKELRDWIKNTPLLIISTARNDELSVAGMNQYIEIFDTLLLTRLSLKPLHKESCFDLLTAYLGGKTLEKEFAERLITRSKGNPFALAEFLKALMNQGVLILGNLEWKVDQDLLEKIDLPNDVVDLLIKRISELSEEALSSLEQAAILGYEFDPILCQATSKLSSEHLQRVLQEGLRVNVIEQTESGFQFIHDKIYETFLSRVTDEQKASLNQKAGEALDSLEDDHSLKRYYQLARFYSRGQIEKNPKRVVDANLLAGKKALEQNSYQEAFEFLNLVCDLNEKYQLNVDLRGVYRDLGATCNRLGRPKDTQAYLEKALIGTTDPLDIARIHFLSGESYNAEFNFVKGEQELKKAISALGKSFPKTPFSLVMALIWLSFIGTFFEWSKWGFGKLQKKGREKELERTVFLTYIQIELSWVYYCLGKDIALAYTYIYAWRNSQLQGAHSRSVIGYYGMSLLSASLGNKKWVEHFNKISLDMAKTLHDPEALPRAQFYTTAALEIVGENILGTKGNEVVAALKQNGTARDFTSAMTLIVGLHAYRMKDAQASSVGKKLLPDLKRKSNAGLEATHIGLIFYALVRLGRKVEALEYLEEKNNLLEKAKFDFPIIQELCNDLLTRNCEEDLGHETDELIERFKSFKMAIFFTIYGHAACAYLRLEQYRRASEVERSKMRKQVVKAISEVAMPTNRPPLFECHRKILKGALATIEGKFKEAYRYLDEGEKLALQGDSPWGVWAVTRERAFLCRAQLDAEGENRYAAQAYQLAKESGWQARVRNLEREFNIKSHANSVNTSTVLMKGTGASSHQIEFQNSRQLDALFRMNQASSAVLDLDLRAQIAVDEAILTLGAERGFLFFLDKKDNSFKLKVARDALQKTLSPDAVFSRTVLDKVKSTQKPVIVSEGDQGNDISTSGSILVHQLRSVIAAPIQSRDEIIGILYLDSRVMKALFSKDDLKVISIIATQIAFNLETAHAAELQLQKKSLEQDLKAKKVIQTIIDNVPYGIFMFGSDFKIDPQYSKELSNIFKEIPTFEGISVQDLIFKGSNLNSDAIGEATTALSCCFGESMMQFDLNSHLLPNEITHHEGKTILHLEWVPLEEGTGSIEKIMTTVTDITQAREKELVAQANARELKMIGQLLAVEPSRMEGMLQNSLQNLQHAKALLTHSNLVLEELVPKAKELFRYLHTVKGNSRVYNLSEVLSLVHETEQFYTEFIAKPEISKWNHIDLIKKLDQIMSLTKEYFSLFKTKLKRDTIENVTIWNDVLNMIEAKKFDDLKKLAHKKTLLPLSKAIAPVLSNIPEIAKKLGKMNPSIKWEGLPLVVHPRYISKLEDIFTHLIGNSIDHGMNSHEAGFLLFNLSLSSSGEYSEIFFQDSGKGLAIDKLKERGVKEGLLTQNASDDEIASLIFKSGLSTAENITEISGRGVGMDAVKNFIYEMKGDITIQFTEEKTDQGFRKFGYIIKLPLECLSLDDEKEPIHLLSSNAL